MAEWPDVALPPLQRRSLHGVRCGDAAVQKSTIRCCTPGVTVSYIGAFGSRKAHATPSVQGRQARKATSRIRALIDLHRRGVAVEVRSIMAEMQRSAATLPRKAA